MPGLLRVQKKVFAQKTSPRTFSKLVIFSKILFLANVAAKVATTPKNSEKSCFCFFFLTFSVICAKKNHQKLADCMENWPFSVILDFTETVLNFQKC